MHGRSSSSRRRSRVTTSSPASWKRSKSITSSGVLDHPLPRFVVSRPACARAACVRLDRITCAAALLTFMLTVGSASCGADALPDVAGAATVAVPGVGVSLSGYLFNPDRRTRSLPSGLLLHDAGGNAEDLVDTARVLAEQGYMGLALSM